MNQDNRQANGGSRKGAGRKPSGRIQYVTRLNPFQIAYIRSKAIELDLDECEVIEEALRREEMRKPATPKEPETCKVGDLPSYLHIVSREDVQEKMHRVFPSSRQFEGYMVHGTPEEYLEVWGIDSAIPHVNLIATRIK